MQLGELRVGVALAAASAEELRPQAEAAHVAGLACCQLAARGLPLDDDGLANLRRVLDDAALECVAIGCYLNPLAPDNAEFMGNDLERWRFLAARQEILGARCFVTWSGGYGAGWNDADDANHDPDAVDELETATWDLLAPLDACMGTVAFEPYYKHVLHQPAQIGEFVDMIASPRLGVVMDPPNFLAPGEVDRLPALLAEAFQHLGMHTVLVHLKDVCAANGSVAYPRAGQGGMDYGAFLRHLEAQGRPIDCILEHLQPAEYAETAAFVRQAWAQRR